MPAQIWLSQFFRAEPGAAGGEGGGSATPKISRPSPGRWGKNTVLVGGLEHFLFSRILVIIISCFFATENMRVSREHAIMKVLEKADGILAEAALKHSWTVRATQQTFFEVCTVGAKSPVPAHWKDSFASRSVSIIVK